jgi:FKBP-type peptidyl-prolyl cis-trans isomerase
MQNGWMKRMAFAAVWLVSAQAAAFAEVTSPPDAETDGALAKPPTAASRVNASYGLGVEVARTLKRQGIDIDPDLVLRGLKDVMNGEKLLLNDDDIARALTGMAAEVRYKQARARKIAALDNKKQGEDFLASNREKEGVVLLPSGLQYRILKTGNGSRPGENEMVQCRYRGYLIDGTEIDSTSKAGEVITLQISDTSIIPGLREGLRLMPAGSTWKLFIPHQLAFAGQGAGQHVGPNATLIYEVELIAVGGAAATGGAPPGEEQHGAAASDDAKL